jgi:hypothetical protein
MKPVAAVLFAAGSILISGCGSTTLSERALRADAAAICQVAGSRLAKVARPPSPSDGLPFLERGLATLGPEVAALRRLAPPADLSARYRATVAELGAAVEQLRATSSRLQQGGDPVSEFASLERILAPIVAGENAGWEALQIPLCINR